MKSKNVITLILVLFSIYSSFSQGRKTYSFNEEWEFKKGPFSENPVMLLNSWEQKWQKVTIPHTWNAKDMQEKHNAFYAGEACYRKIFHANEELIDKRIFLRFEGVGQVAELYVNGTFVGNHKGGYSAFAFDIAPALKWGEDNEIILLVDNASRPDIIPVNHSLFGVYGGIYRPVSMIVTDKVNIAVTDYASNGVYISQRNVSSKSANVSVKVNLVNKNLYAHQVTLETRIADINGNEVQSNSSEINLTPQGMQSYVHNYTIRKPHLWQGLDDPYLYRVETILKENGKIIDKVVQPLGLRNIEVRAGEGVFLNGEKYPMYGVCRHQDRWQLGSALQKKHHDEDLALIMEMGATTIRLAHYQQSDYFYSKCDSLGLLIWAEVPFVNRVTGEEGPNAKQQLTELIRQSFNHPSIYVWGMHNEVYQPHLYTAQLTQEMHDLAKNEDPGRYTVAVNGYGHIEHPVNLNTDIQGMNRYFGWYEKTIPEIEGWVEDLEKNFPDQKVMLTEYGADANIHHQTEYIGNTIRWWDDYFPETYQTKIHEIQWGVIEKHPYITASYLWNMFDFAVPMWSRGGVEARNMKGLITFDRKVKKDAFYWYKANWSKEPVVYLTQRRNTDREKQVTTITVYSNVDRPEVYVNDTRLADPKTGTTSVHYIFENVELQKGTNTIKAVALDGEQTIEDQMEWNYSGEKKRESLEYLNDKAHFGF
ncbi:glycoside hydrolase family 2 protein [Draconibacterium mangrovi]|uniref:glycoside hydrolase family 2 protein n=1 Tax=Draconibacterium mangrovi TaxID=2697469 RepID=UPI0013D4515C|nr:glycoside hydrolase family 2 TIM barrel-domain containing protein [Draconibacterium mangrovi]